MAIVKKTLQNLKPGKQYLLTVRAKDADLNNTLDPSAAIRFTVPSKVDAPTELGNLEIAANYQSIMISFNPSNDIDLKWYKYRVYTQNQIEVNGLEYTPVNENVFLLEGYSVSNVITVDVQENSSATPNLNGTTTTNNVVYYAKVRSVDNSGNESAWTQIASSAATPLIQSAHIANLTAGKIVSGTIGAHEITLGGATSIIKSSTYDFAAPTTGWFIKGNGEASIGGPNGINFNGSTIAPAITLGSNVTIQAGVAVPNSDGVSFTGLTISVAVGSVGGIQLGSNSNNQWLTSGYFRTGNNDKYLLFNPAGAGSLTINGTVIQNGTVGGVSAATTKIHLGTGTYANANTPFYVGRETSEATSVNKFSLGNKLTWDGATLTIDGTVTIGSQSASAISTAVTTANNAATAAATAQTTANSKVNPSDVLNHIGGTNVTTISGGKVTTGAISSVDGTCQINLDNGSVNFRNKFIVDSAGNASFSGSLSAASGTFSGALSGATGSIGNSLTVGNNVRINGAAGDGANSVLKVRADDQPNDNVTNTGREPLRLVSYINNTAFRVLYDGRCRYGLNMQLDSDIRLKKNIQTTSLGLDFIKKLNPVSYQWKKEGIGEPNRRHHGFIAQEVEQVSNEFQEKFQAQSLDDNSDPSSTQSLDYVQFLSPLVKAVQELSAKVDELESRLV